MPDGPAHSEQQKNRMSGDESANPNAPAQDETKEESVSADLNGEASKPIAKKGKQSSAVPSKRKAKASDEPSKAPRRSARGAPQASIDPPKMIQFLLSPDSIDLCRPKDETEDLKNRGDIKAYSSSAFSPFEELIGAVILSRPISHALGLRSIRTIFNEPYNFTTPKALREAGPEGRRKALDEARTQHRQETAEELGSLADQAVDTIGDGEDDVSLEKEREILKKSVKGLGKTGLDIFGRRIQGMWPAYYPFVDQRTSSALEKLGLPGDAEGLRQLLEKQWDNLDAKNMEAIDDEEKKRKVFVRVLERAIGADLEGNTDIVRAKAVG